MEILLVVIGMVVYFVPCLVGSRRGHRNAMPIFVLNLFLGWTFVGWVGALVWAMADNVKPPEKTENHPRARQNWE